MCCEKWMFFGCKLHEILYTLCTFLKQSCKNAEQNLAIIKQLMINIFTTGKSGLSEANWLWTEGGLYFTRKTSIVVRFSHGKDKVHRKKKTTVTVSLSCVFKKPYHTILVKIKIIFSTNIFHKLWRTYTFTEK